MAHGQIFARFALVNGSTRLIEHRQNAPLKIARTFPSETRQGGIDVCIMDASPGLLAGDRHEYHWVVEPGAQVRIFTQGATRVHPAGASSRASSAGAAGAAGAAAKTASSSHQSTTAQVQRGGILELWPETIIPFAGAAFSSRTEIEVEDGAGLSLFECLSAGRIARGERFFFERISLQTRVFDARSPLFCSQVRVIPSEFDPGSPFSFGGDNHWANLVIINQNAGPDRMNSAQNWLGSRSASAAISALDRRGFVLSLLARRAQDARAHALSVNAMMITSGESVSRETS